MLFSESLLSLNKSNINKCRMISIAIVLLVISAKSLHISHKQSTPKYNATNYLTDLESRQNQFIADMDLIKQQIAQINQTLDSSTMTSN